MRFSARCRKADPALRPGLLSLGSCPWAGRYDIKPAKVTGISAMQKFTTLRGVAAPLPMINIDTDMIIPKQFLKTIKRTGLGKNLFDELRYEMDGKEKPDF